MGVQARGGRVQVLSGVQAGVAYSTAGPVGGYGTMGTVARGVGMVCGSERGRDGSSSAGGKSACGTLAGGGGNERGH